MYVCRYVCVYVCMYFYCNNVFVVVMLAFYPPKINNMTCSSGAVEIHYEFDVVANDEFSVFRPFSAPKLYYFYGGCRDENNQLIYRVRKSGHSLLISTCGVWGKPLVM